MSIRKLLAAGICASAIGAVPLCAFAQTTRPITRPASAEGLSATVAVLRGMIEVRDDEQQEWRAATVGMVLPIGGEIRTGPNSSVTLTIPPNQAVVIDRLTVVKILEAMRTSKNFKTDIGMRYGRVRYEVEAGGLEHEAWIRSPSNALAIRGSNAQVQDDAFDYNVVLFQGSANVRNPFGQNTNLGSGPHDNNGNSPIVMSGNSNSPAETGSGQTNVFQNSWALTENEQIVLNTNTSNTGGVNVNGGLGMPRPPNVFNLPTERPPQTERLGTLSFGLSWTGIGNGVPDLDLFVVAPGGQKLVPGANPAHIGGANVGRNDHGGSSATIGVEAITFKPNLPLGLYTYGVSYVSGVDPATYKVLVLLDGKQINADFFDAVTPLDRSVNFQIDVTAQTKGGSASSALAAAKAVRKPAPSQRPAAPVRKDNAPKAAKVSPTRR